MPEIPAPDSRRPPSRSRLSRPGRLKTVRGFEPFVPPGARVLVLGSVPSRASLEAGFYYAHPRNRFFRIIERLCGRELQGVDERRQALADLKIALYDVIARCQREGSADSAVRGVIPADIGALARAHPSVRRIVTNGSLAGKLFRRYNPSCALEIIHLPSTSPANAARPLEDLFALYRRALTEF